jgi:hypothetical protein
VPTATAVAVNVFQQAYLQVDNCLTRIRRNLAPASGIVIVNGMIRPDITRLARELDFQVFEGENYGTNSQWNLWWLRMLNFFSGSRANVCFKLDPDTMVDAPPKVIPNADYFGEIYTNHLGISFVQGGVTGLSITSVKSLLKSNLLETTVCEEWTNGVRMKEDLMDDQLLALALSKLGIVATKWNECKCKWREPLLNDPICHAIVHPRYY